MKTMRDDFDPEVHLGRFSGKWAFNLDNLCGMKIPPNAHPGLRSNALF